MTQFIDFLFINMKVITFLRKKNTIKILFEYKMFIENMKIQSCVTEISSGTRALVFWVMDTHLDCTWLPVVTEASVRL